MNGKAKVWLIVAILLIVIGGILFSGVMMNMKWNFAKLSTTHYETNQYAITDSFTHIRITTGTADMVFVPSTDGTVSVECYEQTDIRHSVAVKDGTLCIEAKDTRQWYDHIGINFGSPKITIYLPRAAYGDLVVTGSTGNVEIPQDFSLENMDIRLSTGKIRVSGVSTEALNLSVSTGIVQITDVTCKNLVTAGNTGDITLKNVIAAETISVRRTTGDITFDGCDATALSITTNTGDVKGSLLTDKVFITHTSTGRVDVPTTAAGGRCEITTSTGNIIITIQ